MPPPPPLLPPSPPPTQCPRPRTTQKPEAADAFLTELVDKLFKGKRSVSQVIHNSHVWTQYFGGYAQDVEDKVGAGIKNVKAAKHRHESAAKPRGRFVLFMDAYIQTAIHMLHGNGDEARRSGEEFLAYLTDEVCVQAAMLADASDEGLLFTRVLDDEGTDPAQMQVEAEDFIRTLQCMFVEKQCVDLPGTYTHFMLSSLQRPRVFSPGRGAPERRLGGQTVPDDVLDRCLQCMVCYVKLAVAVTAAEFPSFDIFCAFQAFHLQTRETLLANAPNGAGDAVLERTRATRNGNDARRACDGELRRHLDKLAHFFKVDGVALREQYAALRPCAQRHKSATQCDNATAWREAVRRFSSTHKTLDEKHPHKDIIHVLMRYVCFSISTAAVEPNFAVFKRTFGDQGLGGGNDFENRMAKLIIQRKSTPEADDEVFRKAQACFVKYGGVYRCTYQKRRDSGVPRPRAQDPNSERQWLKRRRETVRAAAAKRPRAKLEEVAAELGGEGHTEAGEALCKKQREKYDRAKVDAYLDGALLEDEESPDLKAHVHQELLARRKRAQERKASRGRLAAVTARSGPVSIRGVPCYVDRAVSTPEVLRQLRERGCDNVPRETAKIFIVEDYVYLSPCPPTF